jgi:glycosyltransferase involved in cell wall biosynthesis
MSAAIISAPVGKSPAAIRYSFVFDEALFLANRGLNVHVITSRVESDSQAYGLSFHGLPHIVDPMSMVSTFRTCPMYPVSSFPRRPTTIYWENLYAMTVSRVIKRFDLDVIHAHFAYPEGLVGLIAKRMTGKPLVVTVHGYDILTEPSVNYGIRLDKIFEAIVCNVLNAADIVIAASKATYDEASRIVHDHSKVNLIYNGVDTNRFSPLIDGSFVREALHIGGTPVIFALRSHEPKYGLEYLIKAASLVQKELKDVCFIIGGDGSLRKSFETLVDELGLTETLIFTGKISQQEAPYYYAMSDIVVVPSLQEAFGLVVSEAMASGKPVIGTDVGGIPDQIIDGYTGFLVKPKDPEAIANKILALVRNKKEALRMGENGRKIAEAKFSLSEKAIKIERLYRELVFQ